jgi:hypothetical protein
LDVPRVAVCRKICSTVTVRCREPPRLLPNAAPVEEGHLPDYLAGWDPSNQNVTAVAATDSYGQTSCRNDVKRIPRLHSPETAWPPRMLPHSSSASRAASEQVSSMLNNGINETTPPLSRALISVLSRTNLARGNICGPAAEDSSRLWVERREPALSNKVRCIVLYL